MLCGPHTSNTPSTDSPPSLPDSQLGTLKLPTTCAQFPYPPPQRPPDPDSPAQASLLSPLGPLPAHLQLILSLSPAPSTTPPSQPERFQRHLKCYSLSRLKNISKHPLCFGPSILATVLFLLSEKLLGGLSTLTALLSPPPPHSPAQALWPLAPGAAATASKATAQGRGAVQAQGLDLSLSCT